MENENSTKKKISKYFLVYTAFVILSFARAISTYVFIVPNAFAPGGIGGIASIVYNVVKLYNPSLAESVFNPAVIVLVLNIPLLIIAFFKLNKRFAFNTALCVLLYSGFMGLFSLVNFPVFQGALDTGIVIVAALVGGILAGVSLGFLLILNSSLGGTDIIARLGYKKNPNINVYWQIFAFDSIIVLFSGIIGIINAKGKDVNEAFLAISLPIFYSFITLYITSKVADVIINGLETSYVFNIITSKPEEISKAVVAELKRGGTILDGKGIYTQYNRMILICVVKKRQASQLKKIIATIDPEAFIYVNKATEVSGYGFRSQAEMFDGGKDFDLIFSKRKQSKEEPSKEDSSKEENINK
ncbi:MAG TPA: YitT family protein [Clostridiales bacterium]|nr:YitT family protein [Clostridiales bacterium]